jgi:hypothetical protein
MPNLVNQPVPKPNSSSVVRVVVSAGGTAVYIALASWSYSAGMAGDMIAAGVLLVLAFLVAVVALVVSEEYGAFKSRSRLHLNLAFALVLAVISCCIFWWEWRHQPMPPASLQENLRAELVIKKVEVARSIDDGRVILNYYFFNLGNVSASAPHQSDAWVLLDDEPTEQTIEDLRNAAKAVMDKGILPSSIQNKIRPGEGRFNTEWGFRIKDDDLNLIKSGKKWLVYFIFLRYIDETSAKGSFRVTEFCGQFIRTFDFWKECYSHNTSYTLSP